MRRKRESPLLSFYQSGICVLEDSLFSILVQILSSFVEMGEEVRKGAEKRKVQRTMLKSLSFLRERMERQMREEGSWKEIQKREEKRKERKKKKKKGKGKIEKWKLSEEKKEIEEKEERERMKGRENETSSVSPCFVIHLSFSFG
jgi:chemotaxis protein histidine kinase CheA